MFYMDADMRNAEGYHDPTAGAAIRNTTRFAYMPIVYICSPYSGDTALNTKKARAFCRYAVSQGCIPVAPHLLLPQFMSEDDERELCLFMGQVLLTKCSEVWVFGDRISAGMQAEISRAENRDMVIRYITEEEITCTQ